MEDPDAEKQAELADDDGIQNQLPTPDPSVHEAFHTNSVRIPVENQHLTLKQAPTGSSEISSDFIADSAESEGVGVEQSLSRITNLGLASTESSGISSASANFIADFTDSETVGPTPTTGSSEGGIRATNTENSLTTTTIEPAIRRPESA